MDVGLLGVTAGLVGIAAGLVGIAAGLVGIAAGLVGIAAGLVGIAAGLVGIAAGLVGIAAGLVGIAAGLVGIAGSSRIAGLVGVASSTNVVGSNGVAGSTGVVDWIGIEHSTSEECRRADLIGMSRFEDSGDSTGNRCSTEDEGRIKEAPGVACGCPTNMVFPAIAPVSEPSIVSRALIFDPMPLELPVIRCTWSRAESTTFGSGVHTGISESVELELTDEATDSKEGLCRTVRREDRNVGVNVRERIEAGRCDDGESGAAGNDDATLANTGAKLEIVTGEMTLSFCEETVADSGLKFAIVTGAMTFSFWEATMSTMGVQTAALHWQLQTVVPFEGISWSSNFFSMRIIPRDMHFISSLHNRWAALVLHFSSDVGVAFELAWISVTMAMIFDMSAAHFMWGLQLSVSDLERSLAFLSDAFVLDT